MSHDRAHLHKLIGIARAGYNCGVHGKLRSSTASSSSHDPSLHFHLSCRGALLSIPGKMETAQWRSTSWYLGPNEVAFALAVPTEWCTRIIEIKTNYALVVLRPTYCIWTARHVVTCADVGRSTWFCVSLLAELLIKHSFAQGRNSLCFLPLTDNFLSYNRSDPLVAHCCPEFCSLSDCIS